MIEAVSQLVSGIVLCGGVVAVVRELRAYRRLSGELREWPRRLPIEVPRVTDTRLLAGLEGERDGVCWRWDPSLRVLRFRRAFHQRNGQLVTGSLRFDAVGEAHLTCRPVSIWFLGFVAAFATWGIVGLALNEGPLQALFGAPFAPLIVLPFALIQQLGIKRMLKRSLLPVVVDEIRQRVAGPLTLE